MNTDNSEFKMSSSDLRKALRKNAAMGDDKFFREIADTIVQNAVVEKNTVDCYMDTWDDPGDYPSGAGGFPLPSYNYGVCEGEVVVKSWIPFDHPALMQMTAADLIPQQDREGIMEWLRIDVAEDMDLLGDSRKSRILEMNGTTPDAHEYIEYELDFESVSVKTEDAGDKINIEMSFGYEAKN